MDLSIKIHHLYGVAQNLGEIANSLNKLADSVAGTKPKMTTAEIIDAFEKVKQEDPKTYYNAMGYGDGGVGIMNNFVSDSYAMGLIAGAKWALDHFTR